MSRFLKKSNFQQAVKILFIFDNIAKVLSFLRNIIITTQFGLSKITDSFNFATTIITTPINLISDAILAGVIPFLNERKTDQQKVNFIYSVALLNIILLMISSILFYFFYDFIIKLLAPGFSDKEIKYVYEFSIVLLISAHFQLFMKAMEGYFRAEKIFGVSNIINFISAVVSLVTLWLFIEKQFIFIVLSQLIGILIGFIFFLLVIPKKVTGLDKEVIKLIWFSLPLILGGGMGVINNFVDKGFASNLNPGDISALTYSFLIITLVGSTVTSPVAGAAYSFISTLIAENKLEAVQEKVKKFSNILLVIFILILILLQNFGLYGLNLVFLRGQMTEENVKLIFELMLIYFPINLYTGAGGLIIQIFYSFKKTVIPTIVSLTFIIMNIILNFLFVGKYGVYTLATTTLLTSIFSTIALNIFLKRKYSISILSKANLMIGLLTIFSNIICLVYEQTVFMNLINVLIIFLLIKNRFINFSFLRRLHKGE